ncbi:vWA domain-containing protein [Lysobacter soyae]|uniref:VWA domain-containing protein n=1 Tax=Lysobacter soyae TaxID=2764185 RepID=A0ABX8WRC3_9GAMM|nr:VWA domain-containing protein [Lysobacter sp. CJ11]QYR53383.1 VWA domain-containing protein [Lysobacter sp. CJ11]
MMDAFQLWHFATPQWLWALPLPVLIALLPAVRKSGAAALKHPDQSPLNDIAQASVGRGRGFALPVLLLIAWVALCVAAARPQSFGNAIQPPVSGRGMMLAVDLSGSMQEEDMQLGGRDVDRLTAAKAVISDFLDARSGDRVGLVVFGDRAFVLTPVTSDLNAVREQLADTVVGLPGQSTAIGDAIALSVKRLIKLPTQARVLIVLTDGVNTAGQLTPLKAAELARDNNVRIHTIAMGGDGMVSIFGMQLPAGAGDVDEATLSEIARMTGGQFFRARDTESLAKIYGEINRLEPTPAKARAIRPTIEHYYSALLFAAATLLLWLLVGGWVRRRE